MTEWTDEELRKADAATRIARFGGLMALGRAFLRDLGAVHPVDARDRERAAWNWCLEARARGVNPYDARDDRYPSLRTPEPLVLSTGTWTRRKEGFLWMQGDVGVASLSGEPIRRNATDNELYAKWLRAYGSTEEAK